MDLGASPVGALRRVLLPLLSPAIFASVAIVFAAAIDNFVISSQLSSSAGCKGRSKRRTGAGRERQHLGQMLDAG